MAYRSFKLQQLHLNDILIFQEKGAPNSLNMGSHNIVQLILAGSMPTRFNSGSFSLST